MHASEFEAPVLSERTLNFIHILDDYIDTRKDEVEEGVEASKHYKTKLFGFKFDFSADEKINAALHLIVMALLEHKPNTQLLNDKEFSALTTSRLGNKTIEYIDLFENLYNPKLDVHQDVKG